MIKLRLKELCKVQGITLNELSERTGVSRVSMSGIATGKQKPSFDTLEKLSEALNVEVAELFAPQQGDVFRCPHCGASLEVREK